ncbi:MAG: Arginase/agmatinase/formimionoglutamate hydrolase, arginase family [Actinomyces urogenitalis DORA_12]|uniref:Arginase/agmatinase/formimionoglutamate hydrolase, arginase family n=1 Tax=Actinomyces urogenitalis DORA_12 TaxID=1403939 RepID=W1VGJ4_9ACTO|nr:MAG: Arginase/agmatinase/formimionoglutamate hydrolase, arginase family [Actinomyces urogenitalis DORA_12]
MQPVAQALEVVELELLHLVGRVAAREVGAQQVALDRVGQDDRGLALVLHGRLVGGVHLAVVVTAALQGPDLLVGPVLDQLGGPRVTVEEVLAHVGAVVGLEGLVVAVERLHHEVLQGVVLVRGQQLVPATAPDDLDDVPACALKEGLQLLDDLAVTTHRAVQALQVAVDDEGEVVQLLGGRQLEHAA